MRNKLALIAGLALIAFAIAQELRKPVDERTWQGKLVGVVPYDFRVPTRQRLQATFWAPDDPHIFRPHAFGVGWSVNVGRVVKLVRPGQSGG